MVHDLLLEGGTLVTASDSFQADLLVRDGKIAAIGARRTQGEAGIEKRDVSGCLVMPGGIDTHVHLEHPIERLGVVTADDFYTGTTAAACGGTTTILDFALQKKGESIEQAVSRRMDAAKKSVVDYGLHVILTDLRDDVLDEIPSAVADGFASFKIFTTFADKHVDDYGLIRLLERTALCGALAYVHCENDGAVRHLTRKSLAQGDSGPSAHPKSRPSLVEGEAVHRVITLAGMVGAPVFIAHVTSAEALETIETARRRGSRVQCETCPQYLILTDRYLAPEMSFDAAKYICTPPIRPAEHLEALWSGLLRGSIQQVVSDHSSFTWEQREMGREDFTRIPNGLPGIETRLALLFSEGVSKGRLSIHRFVELTSENPAKSFGLYPHKGSLSVGSDADIVVIDPDKEWVLDHRTLHQAADYSPYDGMSLKGAPVLTISRGEIVSENGRPKTQRGRGRFLARRIYG